ncbi:hypothetical protein EXIGLDRAFT_708137 [Exidia glandulosa HHB12029]|uniref:Uncharacterized protein n=1 Tax=Exidia glandulosa HHB12029 TaxID=1314781 RepID=A0A166N9B7_EXIGL|nr:hypothetical protein EXIGLDRAFT_708137 [Exidia glandulosa HHB12029]
MPDNVVLAITIPVALVLLVAVGTTAHRCAARMRDTAPQHFALRDLHASDTRMENGSAQTPHPNGKHVPAAQALPSPSQNADDKEGELSDSDDGSVTYGAISTDSELTPGMQTFTNVRRPKDKRVYSKEKRYRLRDNRVVHIKKIQIGTKVTRPWPADPDEM